MHCPACHEPLVVLESDAVEIDYCMACRGVWLDAGELELLFGDAHACADFLAIGSPADPRGEKPRRCPICRAKMTKETTQSDPPILLDHCSAGDGIWFDAGELTTVLEHAQALGTAQGADVSKFLNSVFSAEPSQTDGDAPHNLA